MKVYKETKKEDGSEELSLKVVYCPKFSDDFINTLEQYLSNPDMIKQAWREAQKECDKILRGE